MFIRSSYSRFTHVKPVIVPALSPMMKTIVGLIEKQLESGKREAIFSFLGDGENVTQVASLREIQKDALKFSKHLTKEVTVLILLPQGISFIKAFFGCLYAQAIAVPTPLPTKNRGLEKLNNIIDDAGISFGITTQNTLENLKKWFGEEALPRGVKWFFIEDIEPENQSNTFLLDLPKPNQIAFLQYTSGSTDKPKAVMVTHENIIANSQIIQACFQNNAESVSVCWLPSFHDMGLLDGIIQPVFSGFHGVLMSPMHFLQRPLRWLKAITKYRATYSGGPNFAFNFCCERINDEELAGLDLSSLQCLYNGSEPIRNQTMQKFIERFSAVGFSAGKMLTCYGLAEATLAVTTSKTGTKPTVLKVAQNKFQQNQEQRTENESVIEVVGCGFVHCDTEVKIVNPDDLSECVEGEIGEIRVAGKSVAAGYWNLPDDETFVTDHHGRWLRTGDLGFVLNSELFVTGRMKDLVIIRGKNHSPQDIEQTVWQSHAALQSNGCAAFSVEVENNEELVVVQEIKRTFLSALDYEVVMASIVAEISQKHGIVPKDVTLIPPAKLPKTTSGKIQRSACRQRWQSQEFNALANWRETRYFVKQT